MKIHGVRIYPQSTKVVQGVNALIYVHGSVDESCSDFFYIFRPIASLWSECYFANEFTLVCNGGRMEDPLPDLRLQYQAALVAADVKSQTAIIKGSDFNVWGRSAYFCEGALLPIFRKQPDFELLKRLYRDQDFKLNEHTWPESMVGLLHMWDDIYWQFFCPNISDLNQLLREHHGDPKLKMYFVELDREYPDPSNEKLPEAKLEI